MFVVFLEVLVADGTRGLEGEILRCGFLKFEDVVTELEFGLFVAKYIYRVCILRHVFCQVVLGTLLVYEG